MHVHTSVVSVTRSNVALAVNGDTMELGELSVA